VALERGVPMVALLTDFGTADGYAGVMKAVILGIAPGVPVVDLSHDVPPQDVPGGAWVLHTLWRYLPQGTVCVAVVDPGVGTERRPVALRCQERTFVGPDNGLFSYVLGAAPAGAAVVLDNPLYQLPAPSTTFHGRDIFAPAAGHLAAGVELSQLGTPIDAGALSRFIPPRPAQHPEGLLGSVVHVDRFGNLITSFGPAFVHAVLDDPHVSLRVGPAEIGARAHTFGSAPANTPFALVDSSGHIAIAVREGSAAARLGAGTGTDVLALGAKNPGLE
jgi:S-adenosyl-L-methionine hydrolase (adenosine-forming)